MARVLYLCCCSKGSEKSPAGPAALRRWPPADAVYDSMRDLHSVQSGHRGNMTDIALSRAYFPSLHPHPPQCTGEARAVYGAEGAASLMLQESTFGGHVSSTSMFGPVQRTLSRCICGRLPRKGRNLGEQCTSVYHCQMDYKFSLDCAYYCGGTEWIPWYFSLTPTLLNLIK